MDPREQVPDRRGPQGRAGRYGLVLALVLGSIVVPLSVPDGAAGIGTTVALQSFALLAIVWAAGSTAPQRRFAAIGTTVAVGPAIPSV